MVKRVLKFIFGGLVAMHALNSYTDAVSSNFERLADIAEAKANGDNIDDVKAKYKFVPIPKSIYRNCKKIVEQFKRYMILSFKD